MLQRFARAVGWLNGDRGSQESKLLVATVREDDEESPGSNGDAGDRRQDRRHEHDAHEIGHAAEAAALTGYCRDHRGKLQSLYELREDVAQDAQNGTDGVGDEAADQVLREAEDSLEETREDSNVGINRADAQAQTARPHAQG